MVKKTEPKEVSSYENLKFELAKNFEFSPLKIEFLCFFEKWGNLHIHLFKNLKLDAYCTANDELELNLLVKKFMTKRQGMISAFVQGIKENAHYKSEIILFRKLINKHDENFKILLTQILNKLLDELNRLQSQRKVTNAYMNSQLSLGG